MPCFHRRCLALLLLFLYYGVSQISGCGIAVHNEVTFRSLENFVPKSSIQQTYKNDMLDSAGFTQAGSFFPDWGYQCLGNNQQSEDAHWPTFIKEAVNYIRDVYPSHLFHTDTHVKGLISFVFAILSHGMADVKWHSLGGLQDYFITAMANSDFHGNTQEAHLAADAGAEFTLRHSNRLSYLNETWQVPVKDLVEIYRRLYAHSGKRIPLEAHIQYCMTTAFAASKVDVEFGHFMFGYYGSKSPFLTEELYDYYRGGIEDMSAGVTDCFGELIDAFEHGAQHGDPDTLCANYFYTISTTETMTSKRAKCLNQSIQAQYSAKRTEAWREKVYQHYDTNTGLLTLTMKRKEASPITTQQDNMPFVLPSSATTAIKQQQRPFQHPLNSDLINKNAGKVKTTKEMKSSSQCIALDDEAATAGVTLTLPSFSSRVGHDMISGYFSGNATAADMAISAPYHYDKDGYQQTGAVFIVNRNSLTLDKKIQTTVDIRNVSRAQLTGTAHHGRFGWSMAVVDMNGDGLDDLAISSPSAGIVQVYLSSKEQIGLEQQASVQIQSQGTVLAGIDVDQDGFKDLVIGCPLCSVGNQPQAGTVLIYLQGGRKEIRIRHPHPSSYDHFGESILRVKDTLLVGAPGFSLGDKQRVGRVYAFDLQSKALKWIITGRTQFQQYGKVMAVDEEHLMIAIASPSEETVIGLQRFWQGGAVRIYNWVQMQQEMKGHHRRVGHYDMEHGMIGMIQGRTHAGHLGHSVMLTKGTVWLGEPMSDRENGRVYRWSLSNNNVQCIRNNQVILARFGSQIGPLGSEGVCITSQRYGHNARLSGAVTFLTSKG